MHLLISRILQLSWRTKKRPTLSTRTTGEIKDSPDNGDNLPPGFIIKNLQQSGRDMSWDFEGWKAVLKRTWAPTPICLDISLDKILHLEDWSCHPKSQTHVESTAISDIQRFNFKHLPSLHLYNPRPAASFCRPSARHSSFERPSRSVIEKNSGT